MDFEDFSWFFLVFERPFRARLEAREREWNVTRREEEEQESKEARKGEEKREKEEEGGLPLASKSDFFAFAWSF